MTSSCAVVCWDYSQQWLQNGQKLWTQFKNYLKVGRLQDKIGLTSWCYRWSLAELFKLVFLCLRWHFKNFRQLYTKCLLKKGVIAAARSGQSKPTTARLPCHLSLYHCANVLIYVWNCLGAWFSTEWEIAWFYRKRTLLDRKQQQKLISVEQRVRLWVFDQNKGSSQHCPWLYLHIHILGCDTRPWKFCSWCLWWKETRRTKKRWVKDRRHSGQQH